LSRFRRMRAFTQDRAISTGIGRTAFHDSPFRSLPGGWCMFDRSRVASIRKTMLVFAALFAATSYAGGCRSRVQELRRRNDTSVASQGLKSSLPDTTFVELSRREERGVPDATGKCNWGPTIFPPSGDTLRGVLHESHGLWVNLRTCVRLVAFGYRRMTPDVDTAGGDSRSITVRLDSVATSGPRKPRSPD
jgi:hypothetical protein